MHGAGLHMMHATSLLLSTIPVVVVAAHTDGHFGLPSLVGGGKLLAGLKSSNIFRRPAIMEEPHVVGFQFKSDVPKRAATICGPGIGSCAAGYCCSASGYCGTTADYCGAPDCQFRYGPACDANTVPAGPSTSYIPRPQLGNIPYGGLNTGGVQDCIKNGVMALTFDDGPYLYTKDLLDLLDKYNAKATFFITGNNLSKGEIDNCATGYAQLIRRMYDSGHQIASHTWSHQNLSDLTTAEFQHQIYYNEMAIRNILGLIPVYMRPPYSECNSACSEQLKTMGYHATYFDLDTVDYLNDSPELIQNSKNAFFQAVAQYGSVPSQSNFLVIEHDIHYQTVYNLTEYILKTMASDGYGTSVTVGTCLGDPVENWYRSAGSAIATCVGSSTSSKTASSSKSSTSSTLSTTIISSPSHSLSSSSIKVSVSVHSTSSMLSATLSSSKAATIGPILSPSPLPISTDGTCGKTSTCQGSSFGNCCSQYNYCGASSAYCGIGCQAAFGSCTSNSASSSSNKPASSSSTHSTPSSTLATKPVGTSAPSTLQVSADGTCGKSTTCFGSQFGNCCSQYRYCGSTTAYCGAGCTTAFGSCSA